MDVNAPGVMAIPVAPVVAQFSMLFAPEFMLVGDAIKDVTFGADPLDEVAAPQPTSPTQASRARTSAQRSGPAELSPQGLSLFLQNELGESIRDPFVADGHTSLVISDLSWLLVASTESDSWSTSDIGQIFSSSDALVMLPFALSLSRPADTTFFSLIVWALTGCSNEACPETSVCGQRQAS